MVLDVIAWVIVGIVGLIFVGVLGKIVAEPRTYTGCFVAGAVYVGVIAAVGWALLRVVGG